MILALRKQSAITRISLELFIVCVPLGFFEFLCDEGILWLQSMGFLEATGRIRVASASQVHAAFSEPQLRIGFDSLQLQQLLQQME
jgi:hypothetical protein